MHNFSINFAFFGSFYKINGINCNRQHNEVLMVSKATCFETCSHPTTQRPTTATNHIQQNQRSTPYAVTHGLCSPEDGHNGARNMLRQKLIINIRLLHLVGFLSLHTSVLVFFCFNFITLKLYDV